MSTISQAFRLFNRFRSRAKRIIKHIGKVNRTEALIQADYSVWYLYREGKSWSVKGYNLKEQNIYLNQIRFMVPEIEYKRFKSPLAIFLLIRKLHKIKNYKIKTLDW